MEHNTTEHNEDLQVQPESDNALSSGKTGFIKKLLTVIGILFIGMILGSGITVGAAGFHLKRFAHPEKGPKMIVDRMRHELDLTDEQAEKVEEIFKSTHTRMKPLLQKEFDRIQSELKKVLTEDQMKKHEEHFSRIRKLIESGRPPFPHGPENPYKCIDNKDDAE